MKHQIVVAYQGSRDAEADRRVLCHAPFVSLNFEQSGRVTSCCYNRDFVLGTYPQQSVREIWEGTAARRLRQAFLDEAEAPGCDLCFHQVNSGNFTGTLMRNFDRFSSGAGYKPELAVAAPRVLEFEISNACNLECVMCGGHWSSAIRARREKLPPLRSPYDRRFVEQLEPFLTEIVAAKFLGGEPLLIERYYQIWESLLRLNPNALLSITTNATVLPDRARELLEGLRASIVVSLDGMTPETYQAIRKNADFERVMRNFEYFERYSKRRGTMLSIAVCPMTHNWRELPLLLEFCEQRRIEIYFNTVMRPVESALCGLSRGELEEVVAHLERKRPPGEAASTVQNRARWDGLLCQLRSWIEEKRQFERRCGELGTRVRSFAGRHAAADADAEGLERAVAPLIVASQLESELNALPIAELGNILPQKPLPAWSDDHAPAVYDILLAVQALDRVRGAQAGGAGTEPDGVLEERNRLRKSLDWLAQRDPGRQRQRSVAGWIRARIQRGEVAMLLDWARKLLRSTDVDWNVTFDTFDIADGGLTEDEMRQRLPAAMELLRRRGRDEGACGRIVEYYERILFERLRRPMLTWLQPEGTDSKAGAGDAPMPPVRDFDDLSLVLDAMFVYCTCAEPARDHGQLRERLDFILSQLAEKSRAQKVCHAMERHLDTAFRRIITASDDALASDLRAL